MLDLARRSRRAALAAVLLAGVAAPATAAAEETKPAAAPIAPQGDPVSLEVDASVGVSGRLGGAANYDVTSRGGALLGGSVWILPSPRFSLGLAYEHVGLGQERGDFLPSGSVDVTRGLHALWLELELYALRTDRVGLFLVLAPGLGVEHATASGFVNEYPTSAGTLVPIASATPIQCSASDTPSFGLRAGIGADLKLAAGAYARLAFTADNHRLSSDPIGDCIGGSGTTTILASSLSFGYRFDISHYAR
jgi:hypothetical protein